MKQLTITVFGANGNVGSHFINQALSKGHKLNAFVRNKSKFKHLGNPNIIVFEGDATKLEDVERAIVGSDAVVSCLGNVKVNEQYITIMHDAHDNILKASAKQTKPSKCVLISSIGCGGTSWVVKQMLQLIGGKAGFADYEKADKRIREETVVPFVLVRPYALTDKKGTGRYFATMKQNGTFLQSISREDVATFMLDAVSDTKWDGSPGVLIGGAKR